MYYSKRLNYLPPASGADWKETIVERYKLAFCFCFSLRLSQFNNAPLLGINNIIIYDVPGWRFNNNLHLSF